MYTRCLGIYEFVRKGDYPVMGVTKMTPEAVEKMNAKKFKFYNVKPTPENPMPEILP